MCCGCCRFCLSVLTLEGAEAQGPQGEGYGFSWHSWSHTAIKRKSFLSRGGAWALLLRGAQEQEGEGSSVSLCVLWWGGGGWRWGQREAVGPVHAPGHLAPGPVFPALLLLDPRLELRKSLRNPGGSPRWLPGNPLHLPRPAPSPLPRSCPGPPSTSGPEPRASKRLRSRGGQGWPQAGHPAAPQKGQQKKCPPGPCGQG